MLKNTKLTIKIHTTFKISKKTINVKDKVIIKLHYYDILRAFYKAIVLVILKLKRIKFKIYYFVQSMIIRRQKNKRSLKLNAHMKKV